MYTNGMHAHPQAVHVRLCHTRLCLMLTDSFRVTAEPNLGHQLWSKSQRQKGSQLGKTNRQCLPKRA